MIGHKAFCALLGRVFSERGILFIAPDYRQFPVVRADDMLADVDAALQWALENVESFGGDSKQFFVAGQSAGAHLTSTLLIQHVRRDYRSESERESPGDGHGGRPRRLLPILEEAGGDSTTTVHGKDVGAGASSAPGEGIGENEALQPWKATQIRGYVGISGPYNLPALRQHLDERGIEQLSFLTHIIGGEGTTDQSEEQKWQALHTKSPAIRLRSPTFTRRNSIQCLFPPMLLIHGTHDKTVPKSSSRDFAHALRNAGVARVEVKYLQGASHTDPIIEDLLFDESQGSEVSVILEILRMVEREAGKRGSNPTGTLSGNEQRMRSPSMLADGFGAMSHDRGRATWAVSKLLIRMARFVNPF